MRLPARDRRKISAVPDDTPAVLSLADFIRSTRARRRSGLPAPKDRDHDSADQAGMHHGLVGRSPGHAAKRHRRRSRRQQPFAERRPTRCQMSMYIDGRAGLRVGELAHGGQIDHFGRRDPRRQFGHARQGGLHSAAWSLDDFRFRDRRSGGAGRGWRSFRLRSGRFNRFSLRLALRRRFGARTAPHPVQQAGHIVVDRFFFVAGVGRPAACRRFLFLVVVSLGVLAAEGTASSSSACSSNSSCVEDAASFVKSFDASASSGSRCSWFGECASAIASSEHWSRSSRADTSLF